MTPMLLTGLVPSSIPLVPILKTSLWTSISDLNIRIHSPWMLIGDFNAILSPDEKIGGNPSSSSSNDFSSEINNLGLIDPVFVGYPFTCSNKRTGTKNIQERIDRGVGNTD